LFDNGDCMQPPIDEFPGVGLTDGVANSPDTDPLVRGNYSFRAVYSGDDTHAPSNSACEPFGVAEAPTTTVTVVHESPSPTGPVWVNTNPAGSMAFDRATVTGPEAIAPATGHVDFELFNNGDCMQPPIATFEDVGLTGGVANSPDTDPLAAGNYSFQAVYSGDDTHAPSISACEPFRVVAVGITLTKTPSRTRFSAAGERITYTFHVVNTGEVELTNITLTDSRLGTITCPHTTLGPGASMNCTATYTTTQADVNAGRVHNTARVTGRPPTGPEVEDTAEATVTAEHAPGIELTKTPSRTTFSAAGQRITYTFHVVNTGNVTLTNITVTDSRLGTITCPHTTLEPGASMNCTATHTTTTADVNAGRIHNTARVTARPPIGAAVEDTAEATVEFAPAHPAPPTPPAPAAPAGPTPPLAFTGVPAAQFVLAATALLALGVLLLMLARRVRRRY
jgi:uncharacterized repeat protein (TIGR01451 family)